MIEDKKKELKKEFDRVTLLASQMTLDLAEMYQELTKKQLSRVFMATMEYPVPPSKKLTSQDEYDVYQLASGLKETQMKLGMLNLALKELESKESVNENPSV
jgi:hypothetical protein